MPLLQAAQKVILDPYFLSVERPSTLHLHPHVQKQPFCGDVQGWGPFSADGGNLTPCFLDASIGVLAVFGILFGGGAIFYLKKQAVRDSLVGKWVLGAKTVSLSNDALPLDGQKAMYGYEM